MASDDPYKILGVKRDASAEDIRKAYRAIAKKNHPDLNPGNRAAEDLFKAANAANDLLMDPEKRARFDRGEIDGAGNERPPERPFYRDYAEGGAGGRYRAGGAQGGPFGGADADDFGDIFSDLFRGRGHHPPGPRRGADAQYRLSVSFLDAVNGTTTRLTLPEGQTLDVRIPPGITDGGTLRLRGQGGKGVEGGADGDALIEVAVLPHPALRRVGHDLEMDLPVTFAEALLGARIATPTPRGEVTLSVPPRSDSGTRLRLRGRGVAEHGGRPAGDLYATLRIVLGPVDERLEEFLRNRAPDNAADPGGDPRAELRRRMGGTA